MSGEKNGQVLIVGAGASGMMAAVWAARSGARPLLLEHMDRPGKKILSTGNGRCNFTNRVQTPDCYRCGQPDFPAAALQAFSAEETLAFFEELGIWPKERNGYYYPNSDQAASVREALLLELDRLQVRMETGCQIRRLAGREGGFLAETDRGTLEAGALILAAGSCAAPATGSDGSGYQLARSLGHRIVTPLPALVQLRCREKDFRQMAGVRAEGRIQLYSGDEQGNWTWEAQDQGELQLTEYGLSGIPVFQVSRYASAALHKGRQVKASVSFLPGFEEWEAARFLNRRRKQLADRGAGGFLNGLLNQKLGLTLLYRAGIRPEEPVSRIPKEAWEALVRQITSFEARVTGTNSFEQAQVCCGGVDVRQVCPETMESRLAPGLFFAGEILDVDGICGGYNLQWAWSSGRLAGICAAKAALERKTGKEQKR